MVQSPFSALLICCQCEIQAMLPQYNSKEPGGYVQLVQFSVVLSIQCLQVHPPVINFKN